MEYPKKEEFLLVYNSHQPSKFVNFMYKYFSTEAEDKTVSNTYFYILLGLFCIGMIQVMFNLPWIIGMIANSALFIGLCLVVLPMLTAHFINNTRHKKIAKELGLTIEEYNRCISMYID